MSIVLKYSNWENLDRVEKDVIESIDKITTYAEDLDKGFVKVTIEYVGTTWEDDLLSLEEWRET